MKIIQFRKARVLASLYLSLLSMLPQSGVASSGESYRSEAGFIGGPRFGFTHFSLTGDPGVRVDLSSTLGVVAGIYVNRNINSLLTFESDILLVTRNFSQTQVRNGVSSGTTASLTYIDFPFLLRFNFVPDFLSLGIGPSFNFLMSRTYTLNTFDLSAVASLRAGINLASQVVAFADVRYGLGILDIDPNLNVDFKNRDLMALFGIGFKY